MLLSERRVGNTEWIRECLSLHRNHFLCKSSNNSSFLRGYIDQKGGQLKKYHRPTYGKEVVSTKKSRIIRGQ